MSEYINIGKFAGAFGVAGELVLKHALGKKTRFKEIEAVFIEELKGAYLPYFIVSSKAKNQQETFLQLEGIDTREKALRLLQKKVWLLQDDFRKLASKDSPLALLGYALMDNGKKLGKVAEVIEQAQQVFLKVLTNGREVLIPLHKETLQRIDHKKSEVHVRLPEGLLEIYL